MSNPDVEDVAELEPGGYLVVGSVIPPKGKLLAQTQVAVSLKA